MFLVLGWGAGVEKQHFRSLLTPLGQLLPQQALLLQLV